MSKSHDWIEREKGKLRIKYPNKVILVCECEVIKVFDTPVDIREIFKESDRMCKGKDWSWALIEAGEVEVILWL